MAFLSRMHSVRRLAVAPLRLFTVDRNPVWQRRAHSVAIAPRPLCTRKIFVNVPCLAASGGGGGAQVGIARRGVHLQWRPGVAIAIDATAAGVEVPTSPSVSWLRGDRSTVTAPTCAGPLACMQVCGAYFTPPACRVAHHRLLGIE